MNDIPHFYGKKEMVFLPYNSIGSRHERKIGEIGDYGLECCNFRENWKNRHFRE